MGLPFVTKRRLFGDKVNKTNDFGINNVILCVCLALFCELYQKYLSFFRIICDMESVLDSILFVSFTSFAWIQCSFLLSHCRRRDANQRKHIQIIQVAGFCFKVLRAEFARHDCTKWYAKMSGWLFGSNWNQDSLVYNWRHQLISTKTKNRPFGNFTSFQDHNAHRIWNKPIMRILLA